MATANTDSTQEATTQETDYSQFQGVNFELRKLFEDRQGKLSTVNPFIADILKKTVRVVTNQVADEGEFISISRDLILKVEWIKLPSWSMLTEEQVVDAAKMRLKNLDMEIKMQKQQFDQEERMEKSKQEGVN